MSRKTFTPKQIINKLRKVGVLISQGGTAIETSRKAGITEQTYYRWHREYGGMRIDQAKRLKELEKENSRVSRSLSPNYHLTYPFSRRQPRETLKPIEETESGKTCL